MYVSMCVHYERGSSEYPGIIRSAIYTDMYVRACTYFVNRRCFFSPTIALVAVVTPVAVSEIILHHKTLSFLQECTHIDFHACTRACV